jgi:hypothetical protein
VLHVAWRSAAEGNGAQDDLIHSAIAPNGTLVASNPIESNWETINAPAITPALEGHVLQVFFGGIRTINPEETNSNLNWSTTSDRGETWGLISGTVADNAAAYASDMSATRLGDVYWQGWGGTGAGAFAHRGTNPGTPNVDLMSLIGSGCCGYDTNVVANETTNSVVAAWFSNSETGLGVWAQLLDPASGAPVGEPLRMPGTVASSGGGAPVAPQLGDRTPVAALGARGFFVAYPGGYPNLGRVMVWRVGDAQSLRLVKGLTDIRGTTIAATGDGRLWVAFSATASGGKPVIFASRSNVGATRWGTPARRNPPKNTDPIWSLYGDANPGGPLDILATVSTPAGLATWHSQVRPGLTLTGPDRIARKKQEELFRVTDAGDPVQGAKVKVAGVAGTTNASGRVILLLGPFGKNKKSVTGRASKDGYSDHVRSFRVGN